MRLSEFKDAITPTERRGVLNKHALADVVDFAGKLRDLLAEPQKIKDSATDYIKSYMDSEGSTVAMGAQYTARMTVRTITTYDIPDAVKAKYAKTQRVAVLTITRVTPNE
jgi:hypothetical protein